MTYRRNTHVHALKHLHKHTIYLPHAHARTHARTHTHNITYLPHLLTSEGQYFCASLKLATTFHTYGQTERDRERQRETERDRESVRDFTSIVHLRESKKGWGEKEYL